MTMTKKIVRNKFFLLVPVLVVLGVVVFTSSAKKTALPVACAPDNYSGLIQDNVGMAFFEGKEIPAPGMLANDTNPPVLGVASPSDRWIEVDLSEQKLKAWDGDSLFLETLVSTGLPWYPTPQGEFKIWVKLRAAKMEGGSGRYYYYLPNVPYIMYFSNDEVPGWRGYSLHGTYWHSDFGTRRSHGCVNLPTSVAEKLYYWVTPVLPDGKKSVFADGSNAGTRIVIHD